MSICGICAGEDAKVATCPCFLGKMCYKIKCDKKEVRKDMTTVEKVIKVLKEKGWHISFAESCTAGMAAGRLVDVPDASAVFEASYVTYSNESKMRLAGVQEATIIQYGVVSEQAAREMAAGAAKTNDAQVGVGISGIAGPGGATAEKPVGMVCFGFYIDGVCHSDTKYFGAIGRNDVRMASVSFVYERLLELLKTGKE